ncbi:MAG: hypothetical protein MJE68_03495, partial [Proteobacteria bacterium]|nr:hypothetical protein [Pseudomonadota bacterium]
FRATRKQLSYAPVLSAYAHNLAQYVGKDRQLKLSEVQACAASATRAWICALVRCVSAQLPVVSINEKKKLMLAYMCMYMYM